MLLTRRESTVKYFFPLTGDRRNEARERTPCMTHPCSPSNDLIRQVSSCVMKVDGLDIDVGVQGVLVEENRAACIDGSRGTDL